MATIYWPQSPLVQLENHHPHGSSVRWFGTATLPAKMGDRARFNIRMVSLGNQTSTWFKYLVEAVDLSNNITGTIANAEVVTGDRTDAIDVPLNAQVQRFRVTVWNFHSYQYRENPPPGYDNRRWHEPETRYFTVFVQYFGDYSLDYIPITILYDPPYQDWTNAVTQNEQYATRTSIGTKKETGTSWESSESVSGGLNIGIPGLFGIGIGASGSSSTGGSESVGEGQTNVVTMRYQYETTLVADNQRAIGRAYWGALSDIFVLLKNPWFRVNGDENEDFTVSVSPRTATQTRIVIVPAHRLLRPDGDPVASAVPATTRRRLLELNPFISNSNLDLFFPVDTGAPLEQAVNQDADPSPGNRAALIAEYSISNGVTLDLSSFTEIQVLDTQTNETKYSAEVSSTVGMSSSFQAQYMYVGAELGTSGSSSSSRFVQVGYHESEETAVGLIKTARCVLLRNQNEQDLSDIQIWWDKHFSTFMFRKVPPKFGRVEGVLLDSRKVGIRNAEVAFQFGSTTYTTMTDHTGHFAFCGVPQGRATLVYSGGTKPLTVTRRDLQLGIKDLGIIRNVRRTIDMRRSSAWELADALGVGLPTARGVAAKWRATPRPDRRKFERLLGSVGIKYSEVVKRTIFTRY